LTDGWEDRPRYYAALGAVQGQGEDLTSCRARVVLRPKQEQLLRARGSLSPREIWDGLAISKQGAMDLIRPLVKAKLIKRVGTLKNGRYVLR
jgi:hypothetical protein